MRENMDLLKKIRDDLTVSLKAKNEIRASVLRLLITSIHNKEIEKRGAGKPEELDEGEVLELINKEAKKRKEAIEFYVRGNRSDLVEKETAELKILKEYLPAELGEEEIKKAISDVIEKTGAKDSKDFGRVMGQVMKELKGRADAAAVGKLVKEKLSGDE